MEDGQRLKVTFSPVLFSGLLSPISGVSLRSLFGCSLLGCVRLLHLYYPAHGLQLCPQLEETDEP